MYFYRRTITFASVDRPTSKTLPAGIRYQVSGAISGSEQSSTTNNCSDGLSSNTPPGKPATRTLPDYDQHLKALELWDMWKVKPDLPGIYRPGQLNKVVGSIA